MKSQDFIFVRYDADEGMVFDWKIPRYTDVLVEGTTDKYEKVQEHLYVKTMYIGPYDSIDNYIEVPEQKQKV